MCSRALLAAIVSVLGTLSILCSPARYAVGSEKDKAKGSDAGVPKELAPRTVTFQESNISLSKALKELARQSGNQVEDRRREKDESRQVKLDLKTATFWQALDAIAKAADARVSLYERDGKIALVDGPHQLVPVSYSGLFRVTVKELHLHH